MLEDRRAPEGKDIPLRRELKLNSLSDKLSWVTPTKKSSESLFCDGDGK